jgi:hypothetical protein
MLPNPWVILKLHYHEYVLPSAIFNQLMEVLSNLEELDDNKITPLTDNNAVKFLSDYDYKKYKANWLLSKEIGND